MESTTAVISLGSSKNVMTIYDREFNEIAVPMKVPSGNVIYEVDKILRGAVKDTKAIAASSAVMDKAGKVLRQYLKPHPGELHEKAFERAISEAFLDGKLTLAQLSEWQDAAGATPEVSRDNRRVMMEVFAFIVDASKIDDPAMRAELTDVATLYHDYPQAPILQVVANFLRSSGLK